MCVEVNNRVSWQVEQMMNLDVGTGNLLLIGGELFEVLGIELSTAELNVLGNLGCFGDLERIFAISSCVWSHQCLLARARAAQRRLDLTRQKYAMPYYHAVPLLR